MLCVVHPSPGGTREYPLHFIIDVKYIVNKCRIVKTLQLVHIIDIIMSVNTNNGMWKRGMKFPKLDGDAKVHSPFRTRRLITSKSYVELPAFFRMAALWDYNMLSYSLNPNIIELIFACADRKSYCSYCDVRDAPWNLQVLSHRMPKRFMLKYFAPEWNPIIDPVFRDEPETMTVEKKEENFWRYADHIKQMEKESWRNAEYKLF